MATKKSSVAAKKTAAKTTTKKAVRRTKSEYMPGGKLMYVFLVIAAFAAIVAITGIVLEECAIDYTGTLKEYKSFFEMIKNSKSIALGIFGIFLVLACFIRLNNKK